MALGRVAVGGEADMGAAGGAGEAVPIQQFIGVERDRSLAIGARDGLARHRLGSPVLVNRARDALAPVVRNARGRVMDRCDRIGWIRAWCRGKVRSAHDAARLTPARPAGTSAAAFGGR